MCLSVYSCASASMSMGVCACVCVFVCMCMCVCVCVCVCPEKMFQLRVVGVALCCRALQYVVVR